MNRGWLMVLLLLVGLGSLKAQEHFYPAQWRNDAALYEGPVYGLKLGVNCPRMYYGNSHLSALTHDLVITPSVSAFLEFPFLRPCTVAPEVNYQQRGGSFTYLYDGSIKEEYSLMAHCLSFRSPVFFYFPITDRVKPYIFTTSDLGFVLGGKVSLKHPKHELPDYAIDINSSNIKYAYFGVVGGMGLRVNIPLSVITIVVKADAALNWGLTDTYSRFEHTGAAIPVNNVDVYQIDDRRVFRSMEFHLTLGYFINKYDACSTFQH